jgi:hypothetical protein
MADSRRTRGLLSRIPPTWPRGSSNRLVGRIRSYAGLLMRGGSEEGRGEDLVVVAREGGEVSQVDVGCGCGEGREREHEHE